MRITLAFVALVLLLGACGGSAEPAVVVPTGAATAALATSATVTTAAVLPTSAPPAVSSDAPLTGPVIAFTVEDSYEDTSLGLFDTATGVYRDLPSTCLLYTSRCV